MSFSYSLFCDEVLWCCEQVDSLECPECGGYGECMEMVCYGGPPVEKHYTCEYCQGEGVVVNEDVPEDWHREWLTGVILHEGSHQ